MEDVNSILGVTEESKSSPNNNPAEDEINDFDLDLSKGDNDAESILSFVAYTILIFGLFVSAVLSYFVGQNGETEDGWKLFIIMAFSCAVVWAFSMILINISNNLRTIKHLLARSQGLGNDAGSNQTN